MRSGCGAKKGLDSVGGQGLTYPFCCGALSAGGGAPKGRAVLLREALGAKVYRGGSAAGAKAWAETEPGRARAGGGAGVGGWGVWVGMGRPPGEDGSSSGSTPTHLAEGYGEGGDSGFKGPIWER